MYSVLLVRVKIYISTWIIYDLYKSVKPIYPGLRLQNLCKLDIEVISIMQQSSLYKCID